MLDTSNQRIILDGNKAQKIILKQYEQEKRYPKAKQRTQRSQINKSIQIESLEWIPQQEIPIKIIEDKAETNASCR